jgi:phosphoglycolate phosphatase-like HAD superfamily hydrolase
VKRLILFDIDGTLLWTRGAARRAFLAAMIEVYGTAGPIATHSFGGKTDPQIARELLRLEGLTDSDIGGGLSALWAAYTRELRIELASPEHETIVLPGVREIVAALLERTDVLVGLLTGNIRDGADLKLASAALNGSFRFGAYGSDDERRDALPSIAVERARVLAGRGFAGRDIVVIGDTPADVTCGLSLDVHAVGVATGSFDAETLNSAGAHTVFADLSDTDAVLGVLVG